MVESASRARESVHFCFDKGWRLAPDAERIPGPARPRRRLLSSATLTSPRPVLGDLQDAVAFLTFRELPRHLAVHAVESAVGSSDMMGGVADRTGDGDDVSVLVGFRRWLGFAPSSFAVATSRELCVVLSSPRRVCEGFPRSIDP